MAFLIGGANTLAADAGVANSCRFNDGDSPRHQKDFADGHDTAATISLWFKRCTNSAAQTLFECFEDASNYFRVRLESSNELQIRDRQGGSDQLNLETSALIRDPSAWYSLIIIIDTTDGTAADRCKVYINGTRVTAFATETTYGSSDTIETGNADCTVNVGGSGGSDNYLDGYMAEVVFLDGVSQASSGFGEFDEDSPTIWKPIDVSGLTFGTNGFYLDFEASDNLGNDANGGTDLTEVNLAATDQTTDTCTNNFATLNPLDNYLAGATLSEGNTKQVTHAGNETYNTTTIGASSGKWYCEMKHISSSGGSALTTRTMYGIADGPTIVSDSQGTGNVYIFRSDGNQFSGSTESSSWGTAWNSTGEIIGIAMDLDNNKLYFAVNGTWQNSGDPTSGATGTGALAITADKTYFFVAGDLTGSVITNYMNFGNPLYANSSSVADADGYGDFEYAPPSGYYALCTKNLGAYGG